MNGTHNFLSSSEGSEASTYGLVPAPFQGEIRPDYGVVAAFREPLMGSIQSYYALCANSDRSISLENHNLPLASSCLSNLCNQTACCNGL